MQKTPSINHAAARSLVWPLLGWFGVAALCPFPARAETVTQGYAKAQRSASSGHAKTAVQILGQVLRRYPDHEPSRLLLAHLLYELGQYSKAAQQYRRLPALVLSPDIAYEYGVSFFAIKDCARAVRGFGNVPVKAKESNLAIFYLGICALNAYECAKAEALLSKAKDLPPHLEPVRKKALVKANARTCQSAPSASVAAAGGSDAPPVPAYYGYPALPDSAPLPAPPPVAGLAATAVPVAAAADKADVGLVIFFEPALYLKQRNKTANFFGYKSGSSQTLNQNISLKANAGYYLPKATVAGSAPYVNLEVIAAQDWGQSSGTAETYVTQDSRPGTLFSQSLPVPPGATRLFLVSAEGKAGYPLRPTLMLSAGDKLTDALPNVEVSKSILFNELYAGGSLGDKVLIATLRLSQISVTMSKPVQAGPVSLVYGDDQMFNTFSGSAFAANFDLLRNWDAFSLQGKVKYTTYQPGLGYYMSGDTANTKFDLVASQGVKYGIRFTLSASHQLSSQYSVAIADPSSAAAPSIRGVAAQATSSSIGGQVDIKPLDWCFGQISYGYSRFAYSGLDPAYDLAFQQGSTQESKIFTLKFGLGKKF